MPGGSRRGSSLPRRTTRKSTSRGTSSKRPKRPVGLVVKEVLKRGNISPFDFSVQPGIIGRNIPSTIQKLKPNMIIHIQPSIGISVQPIIGRYLGDGQAIITHVYSEERRAGSLRRDHYQNIGKPRTVKFLDFPEDYYISAIRIQAGTKARRRTV